MIKVIPQKLTSNINETNLSKQLQEIFPNLNEVIKEDSNDLKLMI